MSTDEQGTSFRFQEVRGSIPIVLVHGVGLDQTIWNRMLRDLTSYSTLTYDLLGHGDTILPLGAQSFEPFVGQLYSLLNATEISEFVLVGFSLGGQIAKHFASMYPDRIKGLVLISTTYQRTTVERSNMASRVRQAKHGDQPSLETAALQRWFNSDFLAANPEVAAYITAR
ncbi:MAG: alpha/beta hydrolase, partial [Chloroflexota bacterium]|nr:alpha/beta hydrolase [Chloroflexota bacterium]